MQVVLTKELVMDSSHGVLLADLPIATGEKFTIIVLKDSDAGRQQVTERRTAYAHRFVVEGIELPAREALYER
ncbi:hypothetical protein BJL95_09795 [Methylomonas sp. LWB]|uniref:hypothetical protein n=1 Tax=Methylomonas sp. LWB TaxID=1905845 RepID=UPI0008D9AF2D|nr:hypothetical protein [Methylomonas sp. LWB]OHX36079.1 hypothetical protein BJL95_09795 [Methylomonas sp. LWB]